MKHLPGRLGASALGIAALLVTGSLSATASTSDPASPPDLSARLAATRTTDLPPAIELASEGGASAVSRLTEAPRSATLRSAPAEDCTDADGAGRQVCVELGTELSASQRKAAERDIAARAEGASAATKEQPKARTDASVAAVQPLPQWCLDAGVQNTMYITRSAGCGIYSGNLTVTRTVNGATTVVGTMNFLAYRYVYTTQSVTTVWANQIEVSPTIITGEAAGTSIWGTAACTGTACVSAGQSFPTQTPALHASADGESYFQWPAVSGGKGTGAPSWTVTFKAPTAQNQSSLTLGAVPTVRCDQALPGSTSIGCVIPGATPEITYSYSSFPEYGAHLLAAEESGLPGSWYSGAPLHRLTNSTLQSQNRNTACPSSLVRPTGKSCDEYPFASTWEGASTGGGQGRTFDWCQIPSYPTGITGPGYSACMIDATENSRAGSLLNSVLFVPMRVIEADAFYATVE